MGYKVKLLVIVIMLFSLSGTSQTSIFEKYSDNPKATSITIPPQMIQMLAQMGVDSSDEEAKAYLEMVNSITSFKTLATDDESIKDDISKWVTSYSSTLEVLKEVKQEGVKASYYGKAGDDANHIKELLIFVDGFGELIGDNTTDIETIVVSITGNININEIAKFASKMNIPGGKYFE